MLKRLFDILASAIGLLLLLPILLLLSALILLDSRGGVFYKQVRVGKNNVDFGLFKFRTMRPQSDTKGLITVGARDPRITNIGYYLRKYKLDELPQLINVLLGTMSLVGPRPEVRKYVSMYTTEQLQVLSVKPGITDLASLQYFDENEILGKSTNPGKDYIETIMPAKLALNLQYINNQGMMSDIKIIVQTLRKIVG